MLRIFASRIRPRSESDRCLEAFPEEHQLQVHIKILGTWGWGVKGHDPQRSHDREFEDGLRLPSKCSMCNIVMLWYVMHILFWTFWTNQILTDIRTTCCYLHSCRLLGLKSSGSLLLCWRYLALYCCRRSMIWLFGDVQHNYYCKNGMKQIPRYTCWVGSPTPFPLKNVSSGSSAYVILQDGSCGEAFCI